MGLRRTLALVALSVASSAAALPGVHAAVRRIVHFSDVHLNLSTSLEAAEASRTRPRYGADTPLSLLDSALQYASRVMPQPDIILYTGDHVTHGDRFSNDYIRKVVETNVRKLESYFPMDPTTKRPRHVTAITGNSDSNRSYAMVVTDPDASSTSTTANDALSVVSPVWVSSLASSEFEFFERRGYLQYDIDDKLTVLTLNTVPYSPSHYPDTSYLEDPFGQFAWLNATLRGLRAASRVAFIAGHIPPIVDSNRTQVMWHEHYIRTYRSILGAYRDVVKAQLFGHVHSIEFRIPPVEPSHEAPLPPLFTSGALSPKYGNNPSFTVWEFDAETYEMLDYSIHSTDWGGAGDRPFDWTQLFQASTMYGVSSLSAFELMKLRSRMESTASLPSASSSSSSFSLTDYYWNMKARSFNLPPCDNTLCRARTMCSLTWWPTQAAFADCVRARTPALSGDLHALLLSHLVMGFVALVVAYTIVCAVARRRQRVTHGTPYAALHSRSSPKQKVRPQRSASTQGNSLKL